MHTVCLIDVVSVERVFGSAQMGAEALQVRLLTCVLLCGSIFTMSAAEQAVTKLQPCLLACLNACNIA